MRVSTLAGLLFLFASCMSPRAAADPAREPAIDGSDYLLPRIEVPRIIAAARQRLSKIAPWASVNRIHVISRAKVKAYFHPAPGDYIAPPWFVIEHIKREWRITEEKTAVPIIFEP
jgi:hypothetical protein